MSLLSPSLEAFWAVAQTGTVLKAAQNVKLTQTGVTQRIRSLEKQLGVTLFTRSRKGMLLTQEGESLLRYVKNARDLELDTLIGLGTKAQMAPPEISICVSPCLLQTRALPHLKALQTKTPLLKLKVLAASVEESLHLLKTAEAQIALIHTPPSVKEIEVRRLSSARFVFVGPANWKRRPWNEVLKDESFIWPGDLPQDLRNKIKQHKALAHPSVLVPDSRSALDMALAGLGYTLCAEELLQHRADKKSFAVLESRLALEFSVSLLWYPRKAMPGYFKSVLTELSR
jgi:LysR family transcriptional regulator (chromosome initiation inhibitor)